MSFEDMMVTPAMYRDLGSSYMMAPMGMPGMYPGMYPGIYPGMGYTTGNGLKPALSQDKFVKLEEKEIEAKNSLKKTAIVGGTIAAVALAASLIFKIPKTTLFKNLGTSIKNGFTAVKTAVGNGLTRIKNFFRRTPTP